MFHTKVVQENQIKHFFFSKIMPFVR